MIYFRFLGFRLFKIFIDIDLEGKIWGNDYFVFIIWFYI